MKLKIELYIDHHTKTWWKLSTDYGDKLCKKKVQHSVAIKTVKNMKKEKINREILN